MVYTASIVLALCAASPVFGAVIPRDVSDTQTPHWSRHTARYTHEPRAVYKVSAAAELQQQKRIQQLNQNIANARQDLAQLSHGPKHSVAESYAAKENTNLHLWGREDEGDLIAREDDDEVLFAREGEDDLFVREGEDELFAREDEDELFARGDEDELLSREDDDLFSREDDDLFSREDDDLFSREDDDLLSARAVSKSAEEKAIIDQLEKLEFGSQPKTNTAQSKMSTSSASVPASAQGGSRLPANGDHRNNNNNIHRNSYSDVGRRPVHDYHHAYNLGHGHNSEDARWPTNDYHRAKNIATSTAQAKDVPSVNKPVDHHVVPHAQLPQLPKDNLAKMPAGPGPQRNYLKPQGLAQQLPSPSQLSIKGQEDKIAQQLYRLQGRGLDLATLGARLLGIKATPPKPQTQSKDLAVSKPPLDQNVLKGSQPPAQQIPGAPTQGMTSPGQMQTGAPPAGAQPALLDPQAPAQPITPATSPAGPQPSNPQAPPQADPQAPAQPPVGAPSSDPLALPQVPSPDMSLPPPSGAPPAGADDPQNPPQAGPQAPQVGNPDLSTLPPA